MQTDQTRDRDEHFDAFGECSAIFFFFSGGTYAD